MVRTGKICASRELAIVIETIEIGISFVVKDTTSGFPISEAERVAGAGSTA